MEANLKCELCGEMHESSGVENLQDAEARLALQEWQRFWRGVMIAVVFGSVVLAGVGLAVMVFYKAKG